jgi:hypothetical protein
VALDGFEGVAVKLLKDALAGSVKKRLSKDTSTARRAFGALLLT